MDLLHHPSQSMWVLFITMKNSLTTLFIILVSGITSVFCINFSPNIEVNSETEILIHNAYSPFEIAIKSSPEKAELEALNKTTNSVSTPDTIVTPREEDSESLVSTSVLDDYGNYQTNINITGNGIGVANIISTAPILSFNQGEQIFGCAVSDGRYMTYGEQFALIRLVEGEKVSLIVECQYDTEIGYHLHTSKHVDERLQRTIVNF